MDKKIDLKDKRTRTSAKSSKYFTPFPRTEFIVLSDIHYYDLSLGTTGEAYEKMLRTNKEVKMNEESPEILAASVEAISKEDANFVIICGDLTKDGEKTSHTLLAKELKNLLAAGKQVFVINGNHDIENPRASRYNGNEKERVASVSPKEFTEIYADFGYNSALYRDPDSLSYVAEPLPGLWLFALDTCRWRETFREAGKFYLKTRAWIEEMLIKAEREKKAVLVMMHHGLLEHYPNNKRFFAAYVIEDDEKIRDMFIKYGVRLVFSGHFHSQDVALKRLSEGFIYDIETGSLVTYPCPYRIVSITTDQKMKVSTKKIQAIASKENNFLDYAIQHGFHTAERLARRTLRKWGVSKKNARLLAPQIVEAFIAHGTGNEKEEPKDVVNLQGVGLWGRFVMSKKRPLLEGLWQQCPPSDNNLTIDLINGEYS